MYQILKEIKIGEQSYPIRAEGDYRMVLDCFSILNDVELTKEERIIGSLLIFYEIDIDNLLNDNNIQQLAIKMFEFFNCAQVDTTTRVYPKLMDWDADSQLICAAVNKVAGVEVRSVEYMHWWTFMGYYVSIGESLYATILQIRDKMLKGKTLERHEKEFRAQNPQYFVWNSKTPDQAEMDDLLKSVWNSGK